MITHQQAFAQLLTGNKLSPIQSQQVLEEALSGDMPQIQIGFLLGVLQMRGISSEELAGFVQALQAKNLHKPSNDTNVVDNFCSLTNSLCELISIGAAITASASGSAILLRTAHLHSSLSDETLKLYRSSPNAALFASVFKSLSEQNFCAFDSSQSASSEQLLSLSKDLNFKTAFQEILTLCSPLNSSRSCLGVTRIQDLKLYGEALALLNSERALMVHSINNLDLFSPFNGTDYARIEEGRLDYRSTYPEDFGIRALNYEDFNHFNQSGFETAELEKFVSTEPTIYQKALIPQSAALIWTSGGADSFREAAQIALQTLQSGIALQKYKELFNRYN